MKQKKYWCHDIRSKHVVILYGYILHGFSRTLHVSYCLCIQASLFILFITEIIFVINSEHFIIFGCSNIFYDISITFNELIKSSIISHLIRNLTFILYQMHYCKYCNYCIVANIPRGEKINFPYICLDPLLHMSCIQM